MFKFNFNVKAEDSSHESSKADIDDQSPEIPPAREHNIGLWKSPDEAEFFMDDCEIAGDSSLRVLNVDKWLQTHSSELPSVIIESQRLGSDLISGCYEGGMKIWECTWDLLSYLARHVKVRGLCVAELGCGAAIPAIWTLRAGAASLLVQDYNADVIGLFTLTNLNANIDRERLSNCVAFSGDWAALIPLWRRQGLAGLYDLVLTSESIYNPGNCRTLLDAIDCLLAPAGRCYVAAKSFYFGVGGGVRQFERLVESQSVFTCESVFCTDSDLKREILLLRRRTA